MKPNCIYIGCFVSPQELSNKTAHLRVSPLSRSIAQPHITFAFRPNQVDDKLFGVPAEVTLLGYGNDGENEGFLVDLSSENTALMALFRHIEVPHITIAVSSTGKPVNTRDLDFTPIEPIRLEGLFGGYLQNGTVQLHPFTKTNK